MLLDPKWERKEKELTTPVHPVIDLLQRGKKLIENENDWCQCNYRRYPEKGSDRVQYCSLGALALASGHYFNNDPCPAYNDQVLEAISILKAAVRDWLQLDNLRNFASFNDTHTHAEVMAAWDRAIKLAYITYGS